MPYIRNNNNGSDHLIADGGFVPYGGDYTYQGRRLGAGTVFEESPGAETKRKREEETKTPSKTAGALSYTESMRSNIDSIRRQIAEAQTGMFRPLGDVIAPKDVRPVNGPLAARQLTPFEYQIGSILGWIQAHRDSGTVHGVPMPQSDFEKEFEAELMKIGESRGDEFRIHVQISRRDFMEYENIFKAEIAARGGPLAKYSQNVPAPKPPLAVSAAPSGTERYSPIMLPVAAPSRTRPHLAAKLAFIAALVLFLIYVLAKMGLIGRDFQRLTNLL